MLGNLYSIIIVNQTNECNYFKHSFCNPSTITSYNSIPNKGNSERTALFGTSMLE